MRPSFVIASVLALASTFVAASSEGCPSSAWSLVPKNGKCMCKSGTVNPIWQAPNDGCIVTLTISLPPLLDICVAVCTAPPHPSHKPKPKRNQPILMPDGSLSRCPSAMTACPLNPPPSLNGERATATISTNEPYECIKPEEDLYNCGGCTSTGKGRDCNTIMGVRGTSCTEGKCMIYTCQKGYQLTIGEQGDQECVRKTPRRV